MSPAIERALRRWRAVPLLLAVLVVLAVAAVALGALAVRVAADPWAPVLWSLGAAALLLTAAAVLGRLARRIPRRTVLTLDLATPLADHPPDDPRAWLAGRERAGLREVVEALDLAAGDERVAGLWCRIGRPAGGLADVQEVREAIRGFRARGKFALAFSESFGELGDGTAGYYLASACDEVVLQPSGDVMVTGLASEVTFLRGAFDRLDVQPQFDHRHEYKSAANVLTEQAFTPAHREAVGRVVDRAFEDVVQGVAAARGLDVDAVRALVDRAPLVAGEALEAGLVDRLGYRDEALDRARARAGEGARLLTVADFRRRSRRRQGTEHGRLLAPGAGAGVGEPAGREDRARSRRRRRPVTVALVHGTGVVTTGRSRVHPLTTRSMGADSVGAALREAASDARVEAVVFRVDSPGGSYVASDAIWREVGRTRDAGKPVVVSMGNVAGSGGYFVALPADRIVAHAGTLTGSIGVVGGKAVVAGLRQRLGLTRDEVHAGAHALMWSNQHPYSPSEWERFQAWLDRCYEDFTGKVADGRRLDAGQVDRAARGRVWSGTDALALGLVDALGGYPRAFAEVRDLLGMEPGEPLRVVPFPRRVPLLARLTGRDGARDDAVATGRHATDLLPSPSRLAADLGLAAGDAALLAPGPWGVGRG